MVLSVRCRLLISVETSRVTVADYTGDDLSVPFAVQQLACNAIVFDETAIVNADMIHLRQISC